VLGVCVVVGEQAHGGGSMSSLRVEAKQKSRKEARAVEEGRRARGQEGKRGLGARADEARQRV
jgi:hypothetical protein